MPGGIIQIATYGSQDIFLTGTPQITFFKVVYRRHTNFAIESIAQQFIGDTNFGSEVSSVIDKIGDLMHKTYIEIILPEINLKKPLCNYDANLCDVQTQFDQIAIFYKLVCDYITENINVVKQLYILLQTNNVSMEEIYAVMSDCQFTSKLRTSFVDLRTYIISDNYDQIKKCRLDRHQLLHSMTGINISLLFKSIPQHDTWLDCEFPQPIRSKFINFISEHLYDRIRQVYLPIYRLYVSVGRIMTDFKAGCYVERYACAWVEEIGNAIIDQIDVRIGPQLIDRHTGDWFILYNKIHLSAYQKKNYYKMIGQVPQLIEFNDGIKPCYKLIIPLIFWFNRFSGLALPLVSLRYHDVMISLRLKNLSDLFYVEDAPELGLMPTIQSNYQINICHAQLYVDYIFLDSDERKRFAQSTHEYLIETVQFNEFENIQGNKINTRLNFAHPCKYMIFFCQPNQYRANPTGRNKPQWNNFGTRPDKSGQTAYSIQIKLNYTEITDPTVPVTYYNYAQPYMYFRHSPTDGEYIYSFSIAPMEIQPSGTCNFSRIDDISINYQFSPEFVHLVCQNLFEADGIQTGAYIGTYVMSYNIIRFMSGMAGLAFQNST